MIRLHEVILPVAPSLYGAPSHPLSLHLERGQFCRVCGPAGSGKTALLNTLALRYMPIGTVSLFGRNIPSSLSHSSCCSLRQQIGFIDESLLLAEHLTTAENIALPLSILKEKRHTILQESKNFLAWLSLESCADKAPETLSYVEKLRVVCARALIARPRLVLLEGDILSTDPDLLTLLVPVLYDLTKSGSTILFASRYTDTLDGLLPAPSVILPYQRPSTDHTASFFSSSTENTLSPTTRESLIP